APRRARAPLPEALRGRREGQGAPVPPVRGPPRARPEPDPAGRAHLAAAREGAAPLGRLEVDAEDAELLVPDRGAGDTPDRGGLPRVRRADAAPRARRDRASSDRPPRPLGGATGHRR